MTHELPEHNNSEKSIKCTFDKETIIKLVSMVLTNTPEYTTNKFYNKKQSQKIVKKYTKKILSITEEILQIQENNPIMISENKQTRRIEQSKAFAAYYEKAKINISKNRRKSSVQKVKK